MMTNERLRKRARAGVLSRKERKRAGEEGEKREEWGKEKERQGAMAEEAS